MATITPNPSAPPLAPGASASPAPLVAAGLSSAEAQHRLTEFGPNEIRRERATSPLALLARQFASPVIWLLLAVRRELLSATFGDWLDASAIGANRRVSVTPTQDLAAHRTRSKPANR